MISGGGNTGVEKNPGLCWAFVGLNAVVVGGPVGGAGIPLLCFGLLAAVCGSISLLRTRHAIGTFQIKAMAIIAIFLGGLLLLGGLDELVFKRAITKAKKATALDVALGLDSAINEFRTEYGALPMTPAKLRTDTSEGLQLLAILLAREKSPAPQNIRGIKFLSVKEGRNRKGGLVFTPDGTSMVGLFDPWGNPYTVELDQDGDGKIQVLHARGSQTVEGTRVIVFSPGPDGRPGTADDVRTW